MASGRAGSRLLSGVLVVLLLMPLLPTGAFAAARPATAKVTRAATRFGSEPIRIQGKRPYGPPIAVSRKGWTTSRYVVLVNYASKADQLLAGPLAGVYNAPILFVGPKGIPSAVLAEIRRLRASRVFVVGNTSRVSASVIAQLPRAGINPRLVKRLGGSNDYVTSRLVAAQIRAAKGSLPGVVIVRADYRYWATGAVPLAGKLGMPILLTTRYTLPYDTLRVLSTYRPKRAIVVGGTGMISNAQGVRIRSLARMPEARFTRLSVRNAYEAAEKLAEHAYVQSDVFDYSTVVLGSSTYLPDPLVAGPWAARIGASLLLVHPWTPSSSTLDFFNSHCSSVKTVYVMGDQTAVLGSVLSKLKSAGETVMKPEANMVGEDVNGLLTGMSPDGSEMYFDSGAALASINTSDVLMSGPTTGAPNGYLRRVTGVRSSSSLFTRATVTVETTQARLEDVFEKGSIDILVGPPDDPTPPGDVSFGAQQATAVDANHVDVAFAGPPTGGASGVTASSLPQTRWTSDRDYGWHCIEVSKDLWTSGGSKVKARGWAGSCLKYYLNLSFTLGVLTKFQTYIEYQAVVRAGVEWTGAGSPNVPYQLVMEKKVATIVVPYPPMVITLYLAPYVKGNVSFAQPGSAWVEQPFWARLGCRWAVRDGWSTQKKCAMGTLTFYSTSPIDVTAYSATKTQVYAKLYDVVGISPMFMPETWIEFKRYHTGTGSLRKRVTTVKTGLNALLDLRADFLCWDWTKSWNLGSLWSGTLYSQTVYDRYGLSPGSGETAQAVASTPALATSPTRADSPTSTALQPAILASETVQSEDFAIDGLTVTGAAVLGDGSTVRLTTSTQQRGREYAARVTGGSISDTGGRKVLGSQPYFTGYAAPIVDGASAVSSKTVDVTFDLEGELDTSTVEPTDFTVEAIDMVEERASVTAAEVRLDGKTVRLAADGLYPARAYRVSVPDDAVTDGSRGNQAGSADFVALAPTITVSAEATPAPATDRWGTAVRFADEDRGWAGFGFGGIRVLHTADGGDTWVRRDGGAVAGTRAPLLIEDFAFPSSNPASAVAVGWSGRWTGGGAPLRSAPARVSARAADAFPWAGYIQGPAVCQWTGSGWTERIWLPFGSWGSLRGARSSDFAASPVGFMTGRPHVLKRTPDGSVTTTDHPQSSMSTTPAADRVPPARLRFAPGGRYGWAVGYSTISRTADWGASWSAQMTDYPTSSPGGYPEGLEGLHVHDSETAWAVGTTGTILHTTDGGASWLPQESGCPTQTLRGVAFYDAYHGYAVGDDVILHTWDGGETWTRIPHEGRYLGISAPRFDRAFLVGRGPEGEPLERIGLEW